jgi:hypothetical protein
MAFLADSENARTDRETTDLLKPGAKPDPTYAALRQAVAILEAVAKVKQQAGDRLQ